jgi:hypothetical protein
MPAADPRTRVDIGFQGGQVLSVRVRQQAYDALSKALTKGSSDRWHELETEDSNVALDLSQIVYVRVDTEHQKVGF